MAMLARGDASRGKALAVTNTVDVVNDRHFGIAGQQEVSMHGVRRRALDRAYRGNQRLPNHLAAKHALPAGLRAAAAEQVHFERFEIENIEQILDGEHERARNRSNDALNLLCCGKIYK